MNSTLILRVSSVDTNTTFVNGTSTPIEGSNKQWLYIALAAFGAVILLVFGTSILICRYNRKKRQINDSKSKKKLSSSKSQLEKDPDDDMSSYSFESNFTESNSDSNSATSARILSETASFTTSATPIPMKGTKLAMWNEMESSLANSSVTSSARR